MKTITSIHNPTIKRALKLHTARGRKLADLMIIFGQRELRRGIENDFVMEEVFVCPELLTESQLHFFANATSANVLELPHDLFEKISYGDRVDGVIGIAARPKFDLSGLKLESNSLVLVLERIEKPGNVGAILRSADAAGADAVVFADAITDPFHPNCIRASTGAVFSMPLAAATTSEIISWADENEVELFAARVDGELFYDEVDMTKKCGIVLGNEADGLSDHWLECKMETVKLPMLGIADSLNVSTTAAILLYEARRQRDGRKCR